jgi:hypothetical protein
VTRNGNQNYRIALEPGEAEVLKKLIEKYFDVVFEVKAQQDQAYNETKATSKPAQKPEKSVNNEEDEAPF